jgi:LuxR family maltose regulon positive regulatory protein
MERLDSGVRGRLVLVSAPAGFGKSTTLSEWVAGCGRLRPEIHPAWLSLDAADGDPARFLAYVVAALRTAAAEVGEGALRMLQSPQPPPTEELLTALLNDVAMLSYDVVLILDDYHVVESEPVDRALAFLLEHLPAHLHLVIATREDPPLPLARWRARGRLTELRAADLRFTPAEAADFLDRVMGLALSADEVAALEARTEGWAAGLQMAALSFQGRPDVAGFIDAFTGSHRFVLDYLIEEVLERQPQGTRDFLLQTAILDGLCGALCDAVTGQTDGKATLERLERGNLFVVPLDDRRQWYRYHHLFADALRARTLQERPESLPALHGRASAWYEANGLRPEAIRHALSAGEFEGAADLIELAAPMVEDGAQAGTWLTWVGTLPEELVRARPVLSAWYGYALLGRGEIEAADARLADAERSLSAADEPAPPSAVAVARQPASAAVVDEEQRCSLLATIAVGRAYRAQALGDAAGALKHARHVLELVPEGEQLRRGQAAALVGMTCWASGDLVAAHRVFADYSAGLLAAGNFPDAISTACILPDMLLPLGRLREAEEAVTRLLQVVTDGGGPLPADAADLHRSLGEMALERGDSAAAVDHLRRSEELGRRAEVPVLRYRLCVARARLCEVEGDLEGAVAHLDEAERLFVRSPLPDAWPIAARRARIRAAQGRVAEALEWALAHGLSVDDDLSYLREFEHLTLARVLVARYERDHVDDALDEALNLLERLLHAAEAGGRGGSALEVRVLQARAHQARGDAAAALAPLERALPLADAEGYVRVVVEHGPPMARLLELAASRRTAPDSARRMLSAFPPASAELLSGRELEVLRLIAEGLTNQEIAAKLYVSPFTVKAHARSIATKLSTHTRTQSAAAARELGLLPESK